MSDREDAENSSESEEGEDSENLELIESKDTKKEEGPQVPTESEEDKNVTKENDELLQIKQPSIIQSSLMKLSIPVVHELFEPKQSQIFKEPVIHPSFSKLVDDRYRKVIGLMKDTAKKYREVFKKDLEEQYLMGKSALSGVRMARCFVVGIHVPKIFPDPLTSKQRARIEYILKYNCI